MTISTPRHTWTRRSLLAAAGIAAMAPAATGCARGGGGGGGGPVTLEYWLWDDKQKPAYEACAKLFTKKNPDVTINITQTAWGQYWQNLTTQIASGTAPDVFTDQVSYYPQFVSSNQILDLSEKVAAAKIDMSAYRKGIADLYQIDKKIYGLPKDWDTMALVYNTAVAEKAGYTAEKIAALDWNPSDGGSFEQFLAAMTTDSAGRSALDPAFDKSAVASHGFYPEWGDGATGQNGWGNFAAMNGFQYADSRVMPTSFHYGSPELVATIDWFKGLIAKGIAPQFDKQSSLGTDATLNSGKANSTVAGSWTTGTYLGADATQKFAYAPLPTGPQGRKAAMNGLSDAIWAGTKHPDEAFAWVSFLASQEAQDTVGETGVVFPAMTSATDKALEARKAAGQDSDVFIQQADQDGATFLLPVMDKGNEVNAIVQDAIQAAVMGEDTASSLKKANEDVDALFA